MVRAAVADFLVALFQRLAEEEAVRHSVAVMVEMEAPRYLVVGLAAAVNAVQMVLELAQMVVNGGLM